MLTDWVSMATATVLETGPTVMQNSLFLP